MTGRVRRLAGSARRAGGRALSGGRRRLVRWRRRALAPGRALARQARGRGAEESLVTVVAELEALLFRSPRRTVALLVDEHSAWLPAAVARRWPQLELVCGLSGEDGPGADAAPVGDRLVEAAAGTPSRRHASLAAHGPFEVLVDAARRSGPERLEVLRSTFFHLRKRGVLLTSTRQDDGPGDPIQAFVARAAALRDQGADAAGGDPDWPWARAIRLASSPPGTLLLVCRSTAWPKLRYPEVDLVLARRSPPLGAVLTELPALTWPSRAEVVQNRVGRPGAFPAELAVPALGLRAYRGVRCLPYQVLVAGRLLLPDSYRHYTAGRLASSRLRELTPWFDEYEPALGKVPKLAGAYFYLGSEFPQAYGHVITEQLSRLWGWAEAKRRFPDLRALVQVRPGGGLHAVEREVFGAAGLGPDDLVPVAGPVRVETLVAAAPMLVNIDYVHPGIQEIWDEVATRLRARSSAAATPEKIFIARRQGSGRRDCRNADEVEQVFREHGFAVVYPEELSLPDQVALFEGARAVAGYAGSGLFHLQLCREPKDVLLIRTTSYGARNEYLMASVRGHRLRVLWCDPDIAQPADGWSRAAFHSAFAVDLERDGPFLREQLRQM